MMQRPAFTATPAWEKARPGYPSLQPVQFQSLGRAVIPVVLVAGQQRMKTIGLHAAVERASPSTSTKILPLPRPRADPAAGASAPPRTLQLRRSPRARPTERPPPLPPTARPAPLGLALCQEMHDPRPAATRVARRQEPTDLREIPHGWRLCTSRILASHQTSRCSPRSPRRCSKNSGRKKVALRTHTTATLRLLLCIHPTHHPFLQRPTRSPSLRLGLNSISTPYSWMICRNNPKARSHRARTRAPGTAPCPRYKTHPQWDSHQIPTPTGTRLSSPRNSRRRRRAADAAS